MIEAMGLAGGDWKALYEAAKTGKLDEVQRWLAAGVDPNYQHPEFGTTPLIAAAEAGQLGSVQALVAGGASVAVASDWDGWTALEAAEKSGHPAVARWLDTQGGR